MSEIEVPTEHLHETLHEEVEKQEYHGGGHGEQAASWVPIVALSTAVMAVLAALAALFAGHHANEGVLEQIKASDLWAQYQAKGIKSSVLGTKVELLRELDRTPKPTDVTQIEKYQDEQKDIEREAQGDERSSREHMHHHNIFARTVTLFQIAIALAAISVLSKKKWLWYGGLLLSAGGLVW